MGNKPAVTLTLAADERKLVDSFDRAGKSGLDMGDKVDKASRQVESAGKRMGDSAAEGSDRAGKSFEGMAGKLDSASKGMLAKAAIIGGGLADAILGSFQQANVGGMLAAQLGGGADRAAQLGKLAGQIYGDNFGDSLKDVGEALKGTIGSNLVDEDAADSDIRRVTEKLITVGQVMEEETGSVARAVQQMLRTGMVKSAEEAFDLLVRAQQQGLNKSQDLLDTFNEYSTQFRKIGLDGPTALGLMSQALQGGARDSDIAADALKEFSIRAIDGSKASQNAFHDLGLDGEKMAAQIARGGEGAKAGLDLVLTKLKALKDPLAQNAVASGLFGTQWEDVGAALMAFDVTTATDALGKVKGATDDAMTAIGDTPEAKFEAFKRNMQSSLIDVVNQAAPLLQGLGQFVAQNTDVLGPLAVAIGVVTVAQMAWNAAMKANSIVLIVGLIAGLVAAFVDLWNKSAAFRDFFINLWRDITGAVSGALNAIPGLFKGMINGIVDGMNWLVDHSINWLIDRINDGIISWLPGVPYIPHVPAIPRLHTGGTVPGPPGTETMIMAKAGEHVSAPGQGGGGWHVTGSGALFEAIQAALSDGDIQVVGR